MKTKQTTIEEQVTKRVLNKALEQIDIDALVKRMLPEIQAGIERGIKRAINDMDWFDWVQDAMPASAINKRVKEKLRKAIESL